MSDIKDTMDSIIDFFMPNENKKKDQGEDHLDTESENLAVPEVHVGNHHKEKKPKSEKKGIEYDMLAIPEVHIKKKK